MIDFEIMVDDYVRLERFPNLTYQVFEIQETPPNDYYRNRLPSSENEWKPRARLLYVCGERILSWEHLARWEPLENLTKLNEMQVIARMAK